MDTSGNRVLVSNENPAPYGITLDLEAIAQFGENLCLERPQGRAPARGSA